VLATPRLLAWCEAATCAVEVPGAEGRTSVGTRVRLEHLAASAVGSTVRITATLESQDGRLLQLAVRAEDGQDRLLATGEITRVLVDPERFLSRVPAP
jgi:fluoroacetyl-CoA thioesterase